MAISESRLDELIAIYEEVFGERLDRDEGHAIGDQLLTAFRLLRPPPADLGAQVSLKACAAEQTEQDPLLPRGGGLESV